MKNIIHWMNFCVLALQSGYYNKEFLYLWNLFFALFLNYIFLIARYWFRKSSIIVYNAPKNSFVFNYLHVIYYLLHLIFTPMDIFMPRPNVICCPAECGGPEKCDPLLWMGRYHAKAAFIKPLIIRAHMQSILADHNP